MELNVSVFSNQTNTSEEAEELYAQLLAFARVAMVPTSFIGLVGNILNLIILNRAAVKDLSVSVYLTGLAIGDLLYCLDIFRWYLEWSGILPQHYNYDMYCKTMNFIGYFSTGLSHWMIFCVSLERMIMVTFPFKAKSLCTVPKARAVVCFFALTMASCVSINFVFVTQIHGVDDTWICWTRNEDTLGNLLFNIFRLIFELPPVVFVLVLNFVTIVFFFRSRAKSTLASSSMKVSHRTTDYERKLTVTLTATGLVFVILELPYLIMLLLTHLYGNGPKLIAVSNICKLLSGIDHACNFFIYILGAPLMRREFTAMMRKICTKRQAEATSPPVTKSRQTSPSRPSPSSDGQENDSTDMTLYSITPIP
ncbi:thyrotropin-releasing hormone receptor-like [Lingula anatina]|uniref:Thyrotropin-releasing hormone receptor-like n=1 Tax=Lingula anatina TaxID=7574 RepID=A0A2R2MMF0_LINAN|nr:thyrotropin-releasing hormone receptor-like [Lingula anatina]|eukprot:XP_023931390.1 thyrotropin-releasing hormone receptor-like [Lingula anatina]